MSVQQQAPRPPREHRAYFGNELLLRRVRRTAQVLLDLVDEIEGGTAPNDEAGRDRFILARIAAGATQAEVAQLLGISPQRVSVLAARARSSNGS